MNRQVMIYFKYISNESNMQRFFFLGGGVKIDFTLVFSSNQPTGLRAFLSFVIRSAAFSLWPP